MMTQPLISIIIPVYNVEIFLEECLQSVMTQSYQNLELILINDGSTDDSGKICDLYKTKDDRIIVIHKENEGISTARNIGLNVAKGEYIFFVDSDDFLDKDCVQKFIQKLDQKIDVYLCSYNRIYPSGENRIFNRFKRLNYNQIGTGQQILTKMYEENFYECSVWANIYSRKFLIENNLIFNTVLNKHEDEAWFLKVLLLADRVKILDLLIYNTRAGRINSISNTTHCKNCLAAIYLSDIVLQDCNSIEIEKSLKKRINLAMTSFYLRGICETNQFSLQEKMEVFNVAEQKKYILSRAVSLKQKLSVIILRVFGFKYGSYILSHLR